MNKLLQLIAFSILLLAGLGIQSAYAATFTVEPGCTSPTPGCFWNDDTTWQGSGVPNVINGDTAIITSGTYVFTHEPANGGGFLAEEVIVDAGGNLVITESFNPHAQTIGNTLTNNGVVTIAPGNDITLLFTGPNPVINGNGLLQIFDQGITNAMGIITVDNPSKTITHEINHRITTSMTGFQSSAMIPGSVGDFVNKGTIVVREGPLVINPTDSFDNLGTLTIRGDLGVQGQVTFGSLTGNVFNNYGLVDMSLGGIFTNQLLFLNHCNAVVLPSLNNIQGGTVQSVPCPPEPEPQLIGGEIIPIDSSSLILAGANSFSWMLPVVLSIIGIGLFVASRKTEN